MSPPVVQALGAGLALSGDGGLSSLGFAFSDWEGDADGITLLRLRVALRALACEPRPLLERLRGSPDQPWLALRAALVELAGEDDAGVEDDDASRIDPLVTVCPCKRSTTS